MKHLGDITKIKGNEIPKVDIITGGSPCQDLSVAGKREGLAGERSGLFMEQIRVIKEMRESDRANGRTNEHIRPRYMVWENVQGAFSSNKGEDFRCVLEETSKIADENAIIPRLETGKDGKQKWSKSGAIMGDRWSIAWRVHDAQFWGVPQRRKRISLIADFGGTTAPEILFERESMSRDTTESREEREGITTDAERCLNKTSEIVGVDCYNQSLTGDKTMSIRSKNADKEHIPCAIQTISFQERAGKEGGGKGILIQDERTGALSTLNNQPVCYGISSYDSNAMKSSNPYSGIYEAKTTRTLDNNGGNPACNQGGMAIVFRKKGHPQNAEQGQGWEQTETNDTLNAFDNGESRTPTIVLDNHPQDSRFKIKEDGVFPTMSARQGAEGAPNTLMVLENHPNDSRVKIREDGVVQTLSSRMGTGGGNVPLVMEQPIVASKASYFMKQHDDGVAETLVATDYKDPQLVAYGLDRASFNQGINAKYDFSVDKEKIGTQVAKGPGAVCQSVVRRLTPLECERLQGYPTIRKVRFTEMTKDEYIAWNINEGHIVVDTEYGKVFATRGQGGIKLDEPKELIGSVVNGYRVVSIRNGNTKKQCRVHRIVWIAEHGVIPDGCVIDHINNDKQDNRLCNLQLLTSKENSTKARADGLYKIHGEAGQAKITDEVHDFIQYVYGNTDLSIRQLSEIFGISKSRVHQIIHDEAWTDIGEWYDSKGKKHKNADSPRYKALGNSIALPFWEWMAERMVKHIDHEATMGSLFDGIGGFPLVYSRVGCQPIWASEIEEFPMAVTKIRFPE